jgi:hypothetical protein
MKFYYIDVKIISGEYELSSASLRTADNEDEAKRSALLGECHYDEEDLEWADGGVYDCHGEFHYKVRTCKEVTPEDAEVMAKYMVVY